MKRLCLFVALYCTLLLSPTEMAVAVSSNQAVFWINSKNYMLNDVIYQIDTEPYVENDQILIPLDELMRSLGLNEKNVVWNAAGDGVEIRQNDKKINFTLNSNVAYVNSRRIEMEAVPAVKNNRVFLPAKPVAEMVGYELGWDPLWDALLIGKPGNLPEARTMPIEIDPNAVRLCVFTGQEEVCINRKIAERSILFYGDYNNVTNAGIAAGYADGHVIDPGQEFSFNKVVGPRTTERDFVVGFDIMDELTVGGGVCRTSTVIYQVAVDAGFTIKERHPHYRPVPYTPVGTDASVSYGTMDLRFINNRTEQTVLHAGILTEGDGRRLWAELWERQPLHQVDMSVIFNNHEVAQFAALLKEDRSFISLEQYGDLLQLVTDINLAQGIASMMLNNQLIVFVEGDTIMQIGDRTFELSVAPFVFPDSNCNFWVPVRDLVELIGADLLWIDDEQRQIILNLNNVITEVK